MLLPKPYQPSYHFIQSLTLLNIDFRLLKAEEAETIRIRVVNKFTEPAFANDRYGPIWESLSATVSRQDVDGWSRIDGFLNGASFLIFFDEGTDKFMIEVPAEVSLTPILEECIAVEFYLTDRAATYLICFNHHDFLIGAGKAKKWIRDLYNSLRKPDN